MTCIRLYIIKISVCLSNQYIYSGILSQRGDVWAHKTILTLPLFYRSACTKPGKGVVMYLCITGIDCDSFCYFSIGFFKWFGSVVFFVFHFIRKWPRPWSYCSWIYNCLCNQYLSQLMFWDRISARCTTICDKVCQWFATGRWFLCVLRFPPPIKLTTTI